jgi:hypothetical protein
MGATPRHHCHGIADEISQQLDGTTHWKTSIARFMSVRIRIFRNEALWPQQHQWLKEKLELFKKVFLPYVLTLGTPEGA